MLKNNNHKTSQHRGSSPSFQEADHGLHEWETGFNSMNQHSDESAYIQFFDQQADQEKESDDQESDARQRKGMRSVQISLREPEFRRNQDDENGWQDDGGEDG